MSPRALIIDDDPAILEDVRDRLESLGHTCDCAESQEATRGLLAQGGYDYVLLDMEIPVKYGRPARIQNGKNLLHEIRATEGFGDVPVIVMTAHGRDGPDLAIEVLRGRYAGADDFINKPFPTQGRTLEKVISDALEGHSRRPASAKRGPRDRPSVELGDPGMPCRVLGKEKKALTDGQYAVISRMLKAGRAGLSKDALEAVRPSARRILKNLRKDADWAEAILMPGQTNGRYRLKM